MKKKRWWTVFLLYPDFMTGDFGADLFVDWGFSAEPFEAVEIVQQKAVDAQRDNTKKGSCEACSPDDFRCIAVVRGRHTLALDATSFEGSPAATGGMS